MPLKNYLGLLLKEQALRLISHKVAFYIYCSIHLTQFLANQANEVMVEAVVCYKKEMLGKSR